MSSGDLTSRPGPSRTEHLATEHCPECSGSLRASNGETHCEACGLVTATDRLDRGPEWRHFASEPEPRERTGAPMTPSRHDHGLSSEIGWDPHATGRQRRQLSRLRREHHRARFRSKAERNLAMALGEIARLSAALDLARSTRERASVIYREAQRAGLPVGRSIETLTAASVYAACRCGGLVRSVDEVASVARCSPDSVEAGYRVLNRELDLETPVSRPAGYLPKLASAVGASENVRVRAIELAGQAEAAGYANGRHPGGVAAACVYRAGHEHGRFYTQAELAEVVGVSTATVRKRRMELDELDG